MQAYDLYSKVAPEVALKIQEIVSDTTTVGEIIDTALYESLVFAVQSGTLTDGVQTIQVFAGDASNMSDEVQVTADLESSDTLIGDAISFAATEDDTVKYIGVTTKKRYARIKNVSTGTTTSAFIGAVAIKGNKRHVTG